MQCDSQTVKIAENKESSQSIDDGASNIPSPTFVTEFDTRIEGVESEYENGGKDQEKRIHCSQILYQKSIMVLFEEAEKQIKML